MDFSRNAGGQCWSVWSARQSGKTHDCQAAERHTPLLIRSQHAARSLPCSRLREESCIGGYLIDHTPTIAIMKSMRVAKKSPHRRRTLTLPVDAFLLLDGLRGEAPRSAYLGSLLEREYRRIEQERFHAQVNAAYTAEVCEETLRVNEEFPVHEE